MVDKDTFKELVFKEGKIKTEYGRPQAGMTNCSVILLEKLIREGKFPLGPRLSLMDEFEKKKVK